jgi:hypothetical protein
MIMMTLCPPFRLLNHQTNFSESHHEHCGFGGHPKDMVTNILQQVTTIQLTREIMRWE